MKNEVEMIERKPTPKELLKRLTDIVPGFGDFWQEDDNLSVDDDGTYSVHRVFAEFSAYLRDNFEDVKESIRKQLFAYVEVCFKEDPHSESGVSNAACTCFLENLAGEGKLSEGLLNYLGDKSRDYFEKWN